MRLSFERNVPGSNSPSHRVQRLVEIVGGAVLKVLCTEHQVVPGESRRLNGAAVSSKLRVDFHRIQKLVDGPGLRLGPGIEEREVLGVESCSGGHELPFLGLVLASVLALDADDDEDWLR